MWSMVPRLQRFCSLSRGFKRFHNTITHCFELPFHCHYFASTSVILGCCLAHPSEWHRGSHRSCKIASRIFENFGVFSVVWIKKVNSSQFPNIVKFWLFLLPILVFSRFWSGFTNFRPYFWTNIIWSGRRFIFCHQSFSRVTHPDQYM